MVPEIHAAVRGCVDVHGLVTTKGYVDVMPIL